MKSFFLKWESDSIQRQLSRVIFRFSFVAFVFFSAVDLVWPGFVTNYFNPFWLLLIAIISGILAINKN
ncbi:MAG: hypothetical protein PHW95_00775 [Patescibacteria group bacterium]|nr:hypothetical protein [Patescibacteria group bacterium]